MPGPFPFPNSRKGSGIEVGADYDLTQIFPPQNVFIHELDEFDFKAVTPEEKGRIVKRFSTNKAPG